MAEKSDNPILDAALQYRQRGWVVLPVNQDKRALAKWKSRTESTEAEIERWFRRPRHNLAILTGWRSGIAVVDIDGPKGLALLQQYGQLPATLQVRSGRPEGGRHAWFRCTDANVSGIMLDGLELKAHGQIAVVPPSRHASGTYYQWHNALPIADLPLDFVAWMQSQRGRKAKSRKSDQQSTLGPRPAWLNSAADLTERSANAAGGFGRTAPIADVAEALDILPNPDETWDAWKAMGMRIWASCGGDPAGADIFEAWSHKSKKWHEGVAETEWTKIDGCPPTELGFGSIVHDVREYLGDESWLPLSRRPRTVRPADEPEDVTDEPITNEPVTPVDQDNSESPQPFAQEREYANGHTFAADPTSKAGTFDNPLIELNKKYAVIGDLGGKCLVMSWVGSKVDDQVKVPSFQSFKSFSERYANQYVEVGHGDEAEIKQLGPYWLKWTRRRSFEGLDLVPDGPAVLQGNVLNLWAGFAVEPRAGAWPLMQQHIGQVLASGDREAAWYITRFAAWAVQHPGERAEVALVFRGDKGSGKGTFANALRRVFGQHGLQIFNSKHLVGSFNGHLRTCLLLFADEAFWAGDKQGESVLKGLITEQALMIEQKGVDAAPWRNRLHVIMAANADWVVPATRHERRYAVFDVSSERVGDRAYFRALHDEMRNGGLAAMLHDLLHLDLGDWHPRDVIKTEALRKQKELSLSALAAWWENLLQTGLLPYEKSSNGALVLRASRLLQHAKDHIGVVRELNGTALARFLKSVGCDRSHTRNGTLWDLPKLNVARQDWENKMDGWKWDTEIAGWQQIGA